MHTPWIEMLDKCWRALGSVLAKKKERESENWILVCLDSSKIAD